MQKRGFKMKYYPFFISILFVLVLFTAEQVWTQPNTQNPVLERDPVGNIPVSNSAEGYGLTHIESFVGLKNKTNLRLHFNLCSSGVRTRADCQHTLEDDDGMASVATILFELKREYLCDDSLSKNSLVPNWNSLNPFFEKALDDLIDKCTQRVCDFPTDVINLESNTDSSNQTLYLMEVCGETVREADQFLENSPTRMTYKHLEKLAQLLDQAKYHIYKTTRGGRTGYQSIGGFRSDRHNRNAVDRDLITIYHNRLADGHTRSQNGNFFPETKPSIEQLNNTCRNVKTGRVAELVRRFENPRSTSSGSSQQGIQ